MRGTCCCPTRRNPPFRCRAPAVAAGAGGVVAPRPPLDHRPDRHGLRSARQHLAPGRGPAVRGAWGRRGDRREHGSGGPPERQAGDAEASQAASHGGQARAQLPDRGHEVAGTGGAAQRGPRKVARRPDRARRGAAGGVETLRSWNPYWGRTLSSSSARRAREPTGRRPAEWPRLCCAAPWSEQRSSTGSTSGTATYWTEAHC